MPGSRHVDCTECIKFGRTCNKTVNEQEKSSACGSCKAAHAKCVIATLDDYATETVKTLALVAEDISKAKTTVQAIRTLLSDWVKSSSGTAAAYFPHEAQLRCIPILEGCLKGISLVNAASWTYSDGLRNLDELDNFCAMTLPARPGQVISAASPAYLPYDDLPETTDNLGLLAQATGSTLLQPTDQGIGTSRSQGASLPAKSARAKDKGKRRANPPPPRIISVGPQCGPTAPGSPTPERPTVTRRDVMPFFSISARNEARASDSDSSDDEDSNDTQSSAGRRSIVEDKDIFEEARKRNRREERRRQSERESRRKTRQKSI